MPFNPTANPDLAGEFLYRGISQAGATLGDALGDMLTKQKQQTKDRKLNLGMADSLVESGEMTPLERGRLDNENTDTIKGVVQGKQFGATLKELQTKNALTQQQVDALTYHLQAKKNEDAAMQRFNELMAARQPQPAAAPGGWTPMQGAAGPDAAAQPQAAPPLQASELYEMAARSGLPLDKHLALTEMAKTLEDQRQFFPQSGVGRAQPITTPEGRALPGIFLTPTGPKQSQIVTDVGSAPQTSVVQDAAGGEQTVIYNARTGAPTVVRSGAPQARRADAATIAQLETTLDNLDIELKAEGKRIAAAKEGKKDTSPPTPGRIEELQRRRARISALLDEVNAATTAAPAQPAPTAGAANPNERVKVIGPDGKLYTLPRGQIQKAIEQGYKLAQ